MCSTRFFLVAMLATALSACGGGSGLPPEPTPQLSISSAPIKEELAAGDEIVLKVEGRVSYAGTQA